MSTAISGLGSSQLAQLLQQNSSNGNGVQNGAGVFGQGSSSNLLASLLNSGNGTNGGANFTSLLAGLNNNNSSLVGAMLSQSGVLAGLGQTGGTSAPTQPSVSGQMQNLLDAMFNNASGGTGQMNLAQFTNMVKQMDPNGTSGIKASQLFSQLDPNGSGVVTQAQFDAAITGNGGAAGNTAGSSFGALLDAMFNNANGNNGTFELNITQFTSMVVQMDSNGTSGVNANNLFAALDPNQTGAVTQSMFDMALSGSQQAQSLFSSEMQSLLDAMFNNASGGTGQLTQSQFMKMIGQMDPKGTSGVNSAQLFSQMDPKGTGVVSKGQFDAAMQGTQNQQSQTSGLISQTTASASISNGPSGLVANVSVQSSVMQYQINSSILGSMGGGSSNGNSGLNSLLNLTA